MHQPGTRSAHLTGGGKDEPLAVEAGPFDAEELNAAPAAVSDRVTDTADRVDRSLLLWSNPYMSRWRPR